MESARVICLAGGCDSSQEQKNAILKTFVWGLQRRTRAWISIAFRIMFNFEERIVIENFNLNVAKSFHEAYIKTKLG